MSVGALTEPLEERPVLTTPSALKLPVVSIITAPAVDRIRPATVMLPPEMKVTVEAALIASLLNVLHGCASVEGNRDVTSFCCCVSTGTCFHFVTALLR